MYVQSSLFQDRLLLVYMYISRSILYMYNVCLTLEVYVQVLQCHVATGILCWMYKYMYMLYNWITYYSVVILGVV